MVKVAGYYLDPCHQDMLHEAQQGLTAAQQNNKQRVTKAFLAKIYKEHHRTDMLNALRNTKKHVKTLAEIFSYLLEKVNKYAGLMPGNAPVLGDKELKLAYLKPCQTTESTISKRQASA